MFVVNAAAEVVGVKHNFELKFQDFPTLKELEKEVAEVFCRIDPANRTMYVEQLKLFDDGWRHLDSEVQLFHGCQVFAFLTPYDSDGQRTLRMMEDEEIKQSMTASEGAVQIARQRERDAVENVVLKEQEIEQRLTDYEACRINLGNNENISRAQQETAATISFEVRVADKRHQESQEAVRLAMVDIEMLEQELHKKRIALDTYCEAERRAKGELAAAETRKRLADDAVHNSIIESNVLNTLATDVETTLAHLQAEKEAAATAAQESSLVALRHQTQFTESQFSMNAKRRFPVPHLVSAPAILPQSCYVPPLPSSHLPQQSLMLTAAEQAAVQRARMIAAQAAAEADLHQIQATPRY